MQSTIGVQFQNNAGRPIGSLAISYACEQWRLGASGTADQMNFQYSTNATSLTTGTWTNVAGLNCVSKVTAAPSDRALDGNAAANRTVISPQTITGLNIANGATFWLRWSTANKTGKMMAWQWTTSR